MQYKCVCSIIARRHGAALGMRGQPMPKLYMSVGGEGESPRSTRSSRSCSRRPRYLPKAAWFRPARTMRTRVAMASFATTTTKPNNVSFLEEERRNFSCLCSSLLGEGFAEVPLPHPPLKYNVPAAISCCSQFAVTHRDPQNASNDPKNRDPNLTPWIRGIF